ncbi:MAG: GNAT family N-acetyltransferase [Chitinophagales bacterium]
MNESVQYKEWDSKFFGIKTGDLIAAGDEPFLLNKISAAKKAGYELLYWKISSGDNKALAIAKQLRFFFDTKITYTINTNSRNIQLEKDIIKTYTDEPSRQLIKLAIQAGACSRFKLDTHFKPDAYEKMYTVWIKRSTSGQLATDVFTIETGAVIKAFITFIKRGDKAEIGLIAVDEKFRVKGYGKKLTEFIIDHSFNLGCRELSVITQIQNEPACRLYESCGFNITKKEFIFHIWLNG